MAVAEVMIMEYNIAPFSLDCPWFCCRYIKHEYVLRSQNSKVKKCFATANTTSITKIIQRKDI